MRFQSLKLAMPKAIGVKQEEEMVCILLKLAKTF